MRSLIATHRELNTEENRRHRFLGDLGRLMGLLDEAAAPGTRWGQIEERLVGLTKKEGGNSGWSWGREEVVRALLDKLAIVTSSVRGGNFGSVIETISNVQISVIEHNSMFIILDPLSNIVLLKSICHNIENFDIVTDAEGRYENEDHYDGFDIMTDAVLPGVLKSGE